MSGTTTTTIGNSALPMGQGVRHELDPLSAAECERWEELTRGFDTRELFHRKVWLNYLSASRGAELRFWRIRHGPDTVGYFCGGLLRKGPFRILGSPLKGWGTNYMGPVVNRDVNQESLLAALDELAARERIAMTDLEHPLLEDALLESHQYEPIRTATYIVTLQPGDPDAMWRSVDSSRRYGVRKAERAGLVVEDTDDPEIADEYYDQYLDVMRRKGLVPPYSREVPRLLVRHLRPAGSLFGLRVRDRHGKVVATGLFPHDERTVYFWGGASWQEGRESCPNDLLHWKLMCLAAERGLVRYNMCGDGRFKRKFGGEHVALKRWRKCYWRSARLAQRVYEFGMQKQLSMRGFVERLRSSTRRVVPAGAVGADCRGAPPPASGPPAGLPRGGHEEDE